MDEHHRRAGPGFLVIQRDAVIGALLMVILVAATALGICTIELGDDPAQLLRDFDSSRQDALDRFLTQVVEDQSLMSQLSPDVMELFDTLCPDRPGVRYASVVTMSARPRWRSIPDAGLRVADQASRAVYTRLHDLAARSGRWAGAETLALVAQAPGADPQDPPTADRSDGIVPTWSQPYISAAPSSCCASTTRTAPSGSSSTARS